MRAFSCFSGITVLTQFVALGLAVPVTHLPDQESANSDITKDDTRPAVVRTAVDSPLRWSGAHYPNAPNFGAGRLGPKSVSSGPNSAWRPSFTSSIRPRSLVPREDLSLASTICAKHGQTYVRILSDYMGG